MKIVEDNKNPERGGWKILSSEYVSQRPWHTVRKETLQLPEGEIIPEYYVMEYPDWVNILAITKDRQFIFVEQYRRGIDRVLMELCAGTCDVKNELPVDAAKRELLEETGYGSGEWELYMTISANPGTHNNITYCYLATGVEFIQAPSPEATESLKIHLLTIDQVKDILNRDQMKQALHAAPLWKYIALLES